MRQLEQNLVSLIQSHYPAVYREQSPLLIEFTKAFYEWLQRETGPVKVLKSLPLYKDIDTTTNVLLDLIREKYLRGVQFNENTNKVLAIKKALDLYRAKGSQRAFDLFFRLIFSEIIEFYLPKTDIFRLSSGRWDKPIYLELSHSPRISSWVGKEIRGIDSGATAHVQRVFKKRIGGRLITVAVIDSINGNFMTNEYVADDGKILNAPKVIGSLTNLHILDGGSGFNVGDTLRVISQGGLNGRARVIEIKNTTGEISPQLIYGGWGYVNSMDEDFQVESISNVIVYSSNLVFPPDSNTVLLFDQGIQTKYLVDVDSITTSIPFDTNQIVNLYDDSNTQVANAVVMNFQNLGSNTGSIILRPLEGNNEFLTANNLYLIRRASNTDHQANVFQVTDQSAIGNVMGYSLSGDTWKIGMRYQSNGRFVSFSNNLLEFKFSGGVGELSTVFLQGLTEDNEIDFDLLINQGQNFQEISYCPDRISGNSRPVMVVTPDNGTFAPSNVNTLYLQGDNSVNSIILFGNSTHLILDNVNGEFSQTDIVEQRNPNNDVLANGEVSFYLGETPFTDVPLNSPIYGFDRQNDEIITDNSIILKSINFVKTMVGTFNRLINIDTGSGYNDSPPMALINPGVASIGLPNYRLFLSGTTSSFIVGERVFANVFRTYSKLTVDSNSGIRIHGRVFQLDANTDEIANGIVVDIVNNDIYVDRVEGEFISSNTLYNSTSNNEPEVTTVSFDTQMKPSVGYIQFANSSYMEIDRWFYHQDRLANTGDQVCYIRVRDMGSGYLNTDEVLVDNTFGEGATANIVTFSNGSINHVVITNCGSYSSPPSITIDSNTGIGANLIPVLGGVGFMSGLRIHGRSSGAGARLVDVQPLSITLANNAVVNLTPSFANGVLVDVDVVDSGFGFQNNSPAILVNLDHESSNASALIENLKQGQRLGQYISNDGFPSSTKKLHDGDYYQNYSYEIRSKVPQKQYEKNVQDLLHVAGTKMFGKVRLVSFSESEFSVVEHHNEQI